MDNLKQLVETQKNLRTIEKEVNKYRIQLIKRYQNKSNLEALYNYLSVWNNYKIFNTKLRTETMKFEKLLEDSIISCNLKMNESLNENNSEYNEIMTNIEKFEQDSETSQDVDFSAYDEQQSISISTTTVNISIDKEEDDDDNDNDEKKETSIITKSKFQEINNEKDNKENKKENEDKDRNKNKDKDKDKDKTKKKNKKKRITQQRKYKYDGSVFTEFWKIKNKNRAIYTSTLLYCTETCGQNQEKLKEFIKKYGYFKNDNIGAIIFKSNKKGDYALIRINHLSLKSIKQKMKTLNKSHCNKGDMKDILSIFQSRNILNYNNNGPSSIVFIYNFDITGIKAHKAMTDLLLKYGDFKKDISIRTDKNGDPFAIVYYKELKGAQNLFYSQDELKFGERQLTVSFSQYPDHLYK